MADDQGPPRDELDQALSERLRAVRPSLPVPSPGSDEPSDEELLRYIDGSLDSAERAAFETRLAAHPHAAERVAVVAAALHEAGFGPAPSSASLGRRAVAVVSRFVFQLSAGALTFLRGTDLPRAFEPAAAVRSAATTTPAPSLFEFVQRYPFESGEIEARLALEPAAAQTIDVQLDVSQGGTPLDGVRIKLLREGTPVDSAPTEHGRCVFSALPASRYEFEIRKGGTEVGRMILDIYGDGVA
jgi:hypothetical protein